MWCLLLTDFILSGIPSHWSWFIYTDHIHQRVSLTPVMYFFFSLHNQKNRKCENLSLIPIILRLRIRSESVFYSPQIKIRCFLFHVREQTQLCICIHEWKWQNDIVKLTKAQKTKNLDSTLTLLTFPCFHQIFYPMVKNLTAEHKGNICFYLWLQSVELWKLNSSHKRMCLNSLNLLGVLGKVAVRLRGEARLEEVRHKKDISEGFIVQLYFLFVLMSELTRDGTHSPPAPVAVSSLLCTGTHLQTLRQNKPSFLTMASLCDSSQSRCDSNLQKHFCLWCDGVTGFWTLVRQRSGGCREAKLLPVVQEAEEKDWGTF